MEEKNISIIKFLVNTAIDHITYQYKELDDIRDELYNQLIYSDSQSIDTGKLDKLTYDLDTLYQLYIYREEICSPGFMCVRSDVKNMTFDELISLSINLKTVDDQITKVNDELINLML